MGLVNKIFNIYLLIILNGCVVCLYIISIPVYQIKSKACHQMIDTTNFWFEYYSYVENIIRLLLPSIIITISTLIIIYTIIKAKRSRRLLTGKNSNQHNQFELRGIIILLCTSSSSIIYTYLFLISDLLGQYVNSKQFIDSFTFSFFLILVCI